MIDTALDGLETRHGIKMDKTSNVPATSFYCMCVLVMWVFFSLLQQILVRMTKNVLLCCTILVIILASKTVATQPQRKPVE